MASSPYSIGTITVSNGGTTVTGTETYWIGSVRQNDMLFDPAQGLMARVTADPIDNEELSITPWAGTSLTDAAYEIIPAADTTTSAARLRDLLAQMSVVQANGQGVFYKFSDTTTDADPGAGYFRFNNADPALATAIYIDNLNANGGAMGDIIDKWDDSTSLVKGTLIAQGVTDKTIIRAYSITGSVVDGTGYRKLTGTYDGGSGSLAADGEFMLAFVRTGDAADGFAYDTIVADPSELTALEGEATGYLVFVTDLETDFGAYSGRSGVVRLIAGPDWELVALYTGPMGETGAQGDKGWSPQIAVVSDGARRVHQLAGYVGGAGSAPTANVGEYLKGDGTFTATIGDAADVRGPAGLNGAGTVASVEAGTGISVDNADPTAPVVNAVLASQAEAEAGTENAKLMTPLRTAQAIAALAQGYDPNIALLALEVADLKGARLGMVGGIADPFDTLTGVDVAGSTNLDTGTAGLLKPSFSTSLISTSGKTKIGTITSGGGREAAFDGNASQTGGTTGTACWSNFVTAGYANNTIGVDWGSGTTKTVTRFKVWATSDTPLNGAGGGAAIKLQGSNDNSSWTDLYTSGTVLTTAGSSIDVTSGITTTTAYRYHRIAINANGVNQCGLGEIEFYEQGAANDLTVASNAYTPLAAPDSIRALLQIVENEAITINTDVVMEVTADGANWFEAALVLVSDFGGVKMYEDPAIDVSSDTGTTLKWRVKTFGVDVALSGVVEQWL